MKVYDIETMKECFIVVVYDGEDYITFEVSKYRNHLDRFVQYVDKHKDDYWVGYNNLRFDAQVIEWVLRNADGWHELSVTDIIGRIYQKATDTIHDGNYDVFPEYREDQLTCKQLDLFKIHHFDNKNRRVSLKRLEFEMDLPNIEEMPISHDAENMTREDIDTIIRYCINDVYATYQFYLITIGNTHHPLYKGDDRIQLRRDIEQEFGIPCLNYSDSKIGDEIIKKYYCEQKGIKPLDLPKKGYFRKNVHVANCIAKYVKFQTPQMRTFLERISKYKIGATDDFKESIVFYGNTYSFMKGGLHTENRPEMFEADDTHLIIDWDVSSYYPAIIINNGKYPAHLGKEFLAGYKAMFEKRLELKPQAKKDSRIKGIVNALKLAVNSVYGKSSDVTSWMYDRQLTMFTTITGELSLMMLIEAYELANIRVISANTDGVTLRIRKDALADMERINNWWTNLTGYELERTDYQRIIFSTVNDYIAIKTDGEVKQKGDFLTEFELHKNKSARIVPLALYAYYVNDAPIADTIRSHANIFDFCIRQKASSDFHYEGHDRTTGAVNIYNKLIRYYVSKTGEKILKVKNEGSDSTANDVTQVEAGEWLCTVCNTLTDTSLENVNYDYYIERSMRIVRKIENKGKTPVAVNPAQLSLF